MGYIGGVVAGALGAAILANGGTTGPLIVTLVGLGLALFIICME